MNRYEIRKEDRSTSSMRIASQLFKKDILNGIWSNRWKYLFVTVFFSVITTINLYNFNSHPSLNGEKVQFNLFDIIFSVFRGNDPTDPFSKIIWLMVQLLAVFIVGSYSDKALVDGGIYSLIRAGSRSAWWYSKTIYVLFSVTLYYLIGFSTVIMITDLASPLASDWSSYAEAFELPRMNQSISSWLFVAYCFVLLTTSSIAISMIHLTLMQIMKPIYSYIGIVTILFVSLFYESSYLPGEHSMIMKHTLFMDSGLMMIGTMIYNSFLTGICLIIGARLFHRKDIFVKSDID
ncbi:hypothetical protein [Neobacillus sp. PS2-9]|uniref:hypothetical protein n=1 Tax=Neobacillus sp. PS2-9 TaxID=3070676 RepID=UPI0027E1B7B0|nr:hypothetical protein [Neobacillus sp. PS2-9]WML58719.1 hypothetical protein RCG25_02685 [Neobacillus sp. PS2-9]